MIATNLGDLVTVDVTGDPCGALAAMQAKGFSATSSIPAMRAAYQQTEALCNQQKLQQTPFGSSATLGLRKLGPAKVRTPECDVYDAAVARGDAAAANAAAQACNLSRQTGPEDGCAGLKARIAKYGPMDPQPVIRQALLAKCEAWQKRQGAVSAVNPDEYPEKHGGLDMKTKIAIGVGALVLGAIVLKKMKKR